jgi:WD40 repeat protein/tetratricopeptide (TPR) repeat protein
MAVAFSPDGKQVLTGTEDGTAQLWNVASREPVGEPHRDAGYVSAVAFSPDGKLTAVATNVGVVLREVDTGKLSGRTLSHPDTPNFPRTFAFSPDGRTGLTGCSDSTARLWETSTGNPGRVLNHEHIGVDAVAFSPDGRKILTAGVSNRPQLWDVDSGAHLGIPFPHDGVFVVAFSPDGMALLTGGADGVVRLWDVPTRAPLGSQMLHGQPVHAVAFSPDGATVASCSEHGPARLWDVTTARTPAACLRHEARVDQAIFGPDGGTVLTVSKYHSARLWDTRATPIRETARWGGIRFATLNPAGTLVLTGGEQGARFWDVTTGQPIGREMPQEGGVRCIAFSPDGQTALTGGRRYAHLWQVPGGEPKLLPLDHVEESVDDARFSPDGHVVLTLTQGKARLWNAASGKPLGQPIPGTFAYAFSPDGKLVLAGGWSSEARFWDGLTGKPISELLAHEGGSWSAAFSPDGWTALTGSYRSARMWDVATHRPKGRPMPHRGNIESLAFSPDGSLLATGSVDRTARIWDAATGKPVGPPLEHRAYIVSVAFNAGGGKLLTGSWDGTARLWAVPTPVKADVERVTLWAEVLTGLMIDGSEAPQVLDAKAWIDRRNRLAELGGPPVPPTVPSAPPLILTDLLDYHEAEARAWLSAGQWSAALFHLNRLVAAEPDRASYRRDRGYTFTMLGRWAEAAADYGRVTELALDDLEFGFEYAAVLLLAGEDHRYRTYCAALLDRAGRGLSPREAYLAGRICALAPGAVRDPAAAVRLAEQAVEAEPNVAWHLHGLGMALYRAGQFDRAKARLKESVAADPRWAAQVLNRFALALSYDKTGDPDEARKAYGEATRTSLPALHRHDGLAHLLLRREAEQLFGKAKP